MKRKYEVSALFTKFQVLVENLFNSRIKMFRSDGGWEFDNSPMFSLFAKQGIYFCESHPDTHNKTG